MFVHLSSPLIDRYYQVSQFSVLNLSFIVSFGLIGLSQILSFVKGLSVFPTVSIAKALFSILLLHVAGHWFIRTSLAGESDRSRIWSVKGGLRLILYLMLAVSLGIVIAQRQEAPYHPIDSLMAEARGKHERWASGAAHSNNLAEAVDEYRRRYNQHPPP